MSKSKPNIAVAKTLQQAQNFLRVGNLQAAQTLYSSVLLKLPNNPDALHFSGLLEHFRGNHVEALRLIRASIDKMPKEGWPWNNLGRVYQSLDRPDEAMQAYVQCTTLDPSHAEGYCSIASLLLRTKQFDEALSACQLAVNAQPNYAPALYLLPTLYFRLQRLSDGVQSYERAVQIAPAETQARENVCRTLVRLELIDLAIKFYRDWFEAEPSNPVVQHHLAALTQETTPTRASDAYVRKVFDEFAGSFDKNLAKLGYRAPQIVADHLNQVLVCQPNSLRIGDLGCGTGLCGPLVKPWALHLSGCDLSEGMLLRARKLSVYDELLAQELVQYLLDRPTSFDLLISADTLCYFGELGPALTAAKAALRPRGKLVFTVEASLSGSAAFQLQSHGRYSHKHECVRDTLAQCGFSVIALTPQVLRQENKQGVRGWLVSADAGR
jgi:predicted TPR repeat methyltransferase